MFCAQINPYLYPPFWAARQVAIADYVARFGKADVGPTIHVGTLPIDDPRRIGRRCLTRKRFAFGSTRKALVNGWARPPAGEDT